MTSKNTEALVYAYGLGYRVSTDGVVLSPKYNELTPYIYKNAYPVITVRTDKLFGYRCSRKIPVHRLVAYQLYGDTIFDADMEVRHINGNPEDYAHSNITIGSRSDNMLDISTEVRRRKARFASAATSKLTKSEKLRMFYDLKSGMSYSKLTAKYGVGKGAISYTKNKSLEFKEYLDGIIPDHLKHVE